MAVVGLWPTGTPEEVAEVAESHTGRYLKPMLEAQR